MNLTNLINGEYSKYRKFEDRFNAILDVPYDYKIDYNGAKKLNKAISSLEYKYNHGSIKNSINNKNRNLNESNYINVILHMDEIRYRNINKNYLSLIDINKNNTSVNNILSVVNSKYTNNNELSGKRYSLMDKLNFIDKQIDNIELNNLNLNDLDNLNYTVEKLDKNYYLKNKAKSNSILAKKLNHVKEKLNYQINLTTGLMFEKNIEYKTTSNNNYTFDNNNTTNHNKYNHNEYNTDNIMNDIKNVGGKIKTKINNWYDFNIKSPISNFYSGIKSGLNRNKNKIIGTVAFSALLLSGINSCNDIKNNYYANNSQLKNKIQYEWNNSDYKPEFLNYNKDTFIFDK